MEKMHNKWGIKIYLIVNTPIILPFGRLRQDASKFESRMGYTVNSKPALAKQQESTCVKNYNNPTNACCFVK